ncbi:MAG TPA: sigma-54 dependent transcriptional regulator [Candidatus Krumholzibacteria bacterium]|nr:sigma-54 dependent transcriptional regulator [Candidatus Krumholzibacteria bacterium]HRX50138.1 sigma-54 dependent transcriptional regulator [Candidatus Krumholzibacteria bacterium]
MADPNTPAAVGTILVVDDEPELCQALSRLLSRNGYHVLTAGNGEEALEVLRQESVPLVLSDLMMPRMGGVELLKAAKVISPATEFVIVTGHGTIETAVEAMKLGAYDFVEKPFTASTTLNTCRKAMEKQQLIAENIELRRMLKETGGRDQIIGKSEVMRRTSDTAQQVAPSTATVLLTGESGTGKEVFANSIHRWSERAGKPMIKVSCAAIPETLLESELFGYEKGAFTGAAGRRRGRFEAAHGGTIFLDEIGEVPLSVQVKLLRVLQEGVFERLGSNEPIAVDVRIIAATNADLEEMVAEGTFREDLYYRLNVINLEIPPLRTRGGDLILLANAFLKLAAEKNNKAIRGFSQEAVEALQRYSWPGNVRELENCVERAVVLARGEWVEAEVLPQAVLAGRRRADAVTIPIGTPLRDAEMELIRATLDSTGGDKETAARILGIASRTIYRKIKD